jgi:hypothetical protein
VPQCTASPTKGSVSNPHNQRTGISCSILRDGEIRATSVLLPCRLRVMHVSRITESFRLLTVTFNLSYMSSTHPRLGYVIKIDHRLAQHHQATIPSFRILLSSTNTFGNHHQGNKVLAETWQSEFSSWVSNFPHPPCSYIKTRLCRS